MWKRRRHRLRETLLKIKAAAKAMKRAKSLKTWATMKTITLAERSLRLVVKITTLHESLFENMSSNRGNDVG